MIFLGLFATLSLIQISNIFADQIDGNTINELFQTINKVEDPQLQKELMAQVKNVVYGSGLDISNR